MTYNHANRPFGGDHMTIRAAKVLWWVRRFARWLTGRLACKAGLHTWMLTTDQYRDDCRYCEAVRTYPKN